MIFCWFRLVQQILKSEKNHRPITIWHFVMRLTITTWMETGELIFHGHWHLPVRFGTTTAVHKDLQPPITFHALDQSTKQFTWYFCIKIEMLVSIMSIVCQKQQRVWELSRIHMLGRLHRMENVHRNAVAVFEPGEWLVTAKAHWNQSMTVCAMQPPDQKTLNHAVKNRVHHNGRKLNGADVRHHAGALELKPEKLNVKKSWPMGTTSNSLLQQIDLLKIIQLII